MGGLMKEGASKRAAWAQEAARIVRKARDGEPFEAGDDWQRHLQLVGLTWGWRRRQRHAALPACAAPPDFEATWPPT
jgi:hypothetical protein